VKREVKWFMGKQQNKYFMAHKIRYILAVKLLTPSSGMMVLLLYLHYKLLHFLPNGGKKFLKANIFLPRVILVHVSKSTFSPLQH
jgi:hypothetical protein